MKDHFNIDNAVQALMSGDLVVYPTETVYGIGVDATSEAALGRLYSVKRREPDKPVALIAANVAMAFDVMDEVPLLAQRLAARFWPGPLTIVMPARAGLPRLLLGPGRGLGVRVSPHSIANALTAALGRPITATSANLANEPPARSLGEARTTFGDKIKVYLDGGALDASAPSTVVKIENGHARILRQGAISPDDLREVIGEILI